MKYFVYAISSAVPDKIYIGQTADVEKRLDDHQRGYSGYTARTNDEELFYSDEQPSRSAAMKREKQLKSGGGRAFLHKQLKEYLLIRSGVRR